jgi:outer membrane protein assembly factor BamD
MVKNSIGVLLLLAGLAGCGKFQKIVKNEDWKVRYQAAIEYYEVKQDYYRAGVLLEDLVPILRGTPEAEKAQFYWAYCYFKQRQYLTSSSEFKKFHDTFNRSQFAEEALFMHCYSLYLDSPPLNLDQANTNTAIDEFQDFINRYPESTYAKQAAAIILEMRAKLEEKAFRLAMYYHKLERYKSAVIAFENFQKDYPDSRYQEEIAFRRLESQYALARNSYDFRKKERFVRLLSYYQDFVDKYPQSNFARRAGFMFDDGQSQLKVIDEAERKANGTGAASGAQSGGKQP